MTIHLLGRLRLILVSDRILCFLTAAYPQRVGDELD